VNPDYSLPDLPDAGILDTNEKGEYTGTSNCQARHKQTRPDIRTCLLVTSLAVRCTGILALFVGIQDPGIRKIRLRFSSLRNG
jgi:hypothetical protein